MVFGQRDLLRCAYSRGFATCQQPVLRRGGRKVMDALGHTTTRLVLAAAEHAFAYLSDPLKLGQWSLGCFGTISNEASGLHRGQSLFDGAHTWFRIDSEPRRL